MPFASNGAVRLYYERIGSLAAPAVLLLNGAGRQCGDFADEFCNELAQRGFCVIRYDQRDTGLSSDFVHCAPDTAGVAAALAQGSEPSLPYDVFALAADALAVLDACAIERVHLFGRSLGSAVAQVLALEQPTRVASMTLAIALSRGIGQATPLERLRRLDSEQFADANSFAQRQVETAKAIGNPAYFDAARVHAEALAAFTRGVHSGAIARHFMVGLALPDLRPRLHELRCPVQVIHGRMDKVIPLIYAEETAASIIDAQLSILDDMAHEAPPQLWSRWIDLFVNNAARNLSERC